MAQLVLVLLAVVVGLVGYNEAAKIEKRFRRGPLGVPPRVLGVVCGLVGLIVGLVASAFLIGALIGFVGYDETSKYAKQNGNEPLGVPSWGWGVVCFSFGTIGALVSSTFVVGALVAFVGYNEVLVYERRFGRLFPRVSSVAWGAVWFMFGLIGAVVTSPMKWGVVCSFIALVGALFLLIAETNALLAEKDALIAELDVLIAERDARRRGGASNDSAAPQPAAPQPVTPQPVAPQPVAPQPVAPRWGGVTKTDFLPHR
jgi:hypothetical protein